MNHLLLLGFPQSAVNNPIDTWNWSRSLVLSGACLLVLLISSRTINHPNVGPKMPLGPLAGIFNNISLLVLLLR